MAQQNPNLHLPLVKLIANTIEVVIQNLVHVVRFNVLQLLQSFLEFLFALIIQEHGAFLSFKDLREEFPLNYDHFADLECLVTPVSDKWLPSTQMSLQFTSSLCRHQKL